MQQLTTEFFYSTFKEALILVLLKLVQKTKWEEHIPFILHEVALPRHQIR